MARIAFDMDDVIADAHAGQGEWLARRYNDHPPIQAGQSYQNSIAPDKWLALKETLDDGSFFRNLRPRDGAVEVLQDLVMKHDVYIATAAMMFPNSCAPKFAWISEHLPFFDPMNVVFCGDKSVIATDYLVDDQPSNFIGFSGEGLLFSAHHNQHDKWQPRLDDWYDVAKFNF